MIPPVAARPGSGNTGSRNARPHPQTAPGVPDRPSDWRHPGNRFRDTLLPGRAAPRRTQPSLSPDDGAHCSAAPSHPPVRQGWRCPDRVRVFLPCAGNCRPCSARHLSQRALPRAENRTGGQHGCDIRQGTSSPCPPYARSQAG